MPNVLQTILIDTLLYQVSDTALAVNLFQLGGVHLQLLT